MNCSFPGWPLSRPFSRPLSWSLIGALTVASAAPALAQCGQDSFEPNDTCGTAAAITAPFLETDLAVYKLTDPDYFSLTVPPGDVLRVDVFFSDSDGDVELFLYEANGPCGGPFDYLRRSNSSNNDEAINFTNIDSAPLDVIIKVELFPGETLPCNNYDISVTMAPPFDPTCPATDDDALEDNDDCASAIPLPLGRTDNLWASREDSDFFSFTLQAGETLDVQALFLDRLGDIDLFLYEEAGACGGGIGSGELISGYTETDNERIIWSNPFGQPIDVILEVDVFVISNCNTYDLIVGTGTGAIGSNYCQASVNTTGNTGLIRAQGNTSVSANDVLLTASQLPPNQFGLFVVSETQAFVANVGGSEGNLCLGGDIGRYNGNIGNAGSSGTISLAVDLTMIPQPSSFASVQPGETWFFQLWHRDVDVTGSNLTNGVMVTFQP